MKPTQMLSTAVGKLMDDAAEPRRDFVETHALVVSGRASDLCCIGANWARFRMILTPRALMKFSGASRVARTSRRREVGTRPT